MCSDLISSGVSCATSGEWDWEWSRQGWLGLPDCLLMWMCEVSRVGACRVWRVYECSCTVRATYHMTVLLCVGWLCDLLMLC